MHEFSMFTVIVLTQPEFNFIFFVGEIFSLLERKTKKTYTEIKQMTLQQSLQGTL